MHKPDQDKYLNLKVKQTGNCYFPIQDLLSNGDASVQGYIVVFTTFIHFNDIKTLMTFNVLY